MVPQAERYVGKVRQGRVWDLLLHEYYVERVFVDIALDRVVTWPDLGASGGMEVTGAAWPGPADPQPPPAGGTSPRIDVAKAAARISMLPHRLLAYRGADGFPVVVPIQIAGHDQNAVSPARSPRLPVRTRTFRRPGTSRSQRPAVTRHENTTSGGAMMASSLRAHTSEHPGAKPAGQRSARTASGSSGSSAPKRPAMSAPSCVRPRGAATSQSLRHRAAVNTGHLTGAAGAADLNTLLGHLELDDAVLCGFSMGTGEVTRYLGTYGSGRVRKAVLMGAIPPYLLKTADNPEGVDQSVFDGIKAAVIKDRPAYFKDFLDNFYNVDVLRPERISDQAWQASFNVAVAASAYAAYACVDTWLTDFRADLPEIDVPVLLIHGDAGRILPYPATAARLPGLIKDLTFVAVPGGPHNVAWTHPDVVNPALLDFLAA